MVWAVRHDVPELAQGGRRRAPEHRLRAPTGAHLRIDYPVIARRIRLVRIV
jgi:hypothetical protein